MEPAGLNVLWKRTDLGGRSSPICFRGKLYTITRANPDTDIEGEKVVCLNATTGDTIWQNEFNVFLSDVPSPRVGWSSVVGDPQTGNVFALGVCGFFQCIDGQTGRDDLVPLACRRARYHQRVRRPGGVSGDFR